MHIPRMDNCPSTVRQTFTRGLKALQRAYEQQLLSEEEYLRGLEELLKPFFEYCKVRRKPFVLVKTFIGRPAGSRREL